MPKSSLISVSNSEDLYGAFYRITLHGPPKVGKSVAAATASELMPDEIDPAAPTKLDDMYWWQFDAGALRGVHRLGMKIPYSIDFTGLEGKDIFKGVREATADVQEKVKEGLTKWLVVDTISSLDKKLKTFWREKTKEDGKFALYEAMLTSHNRFFEIVNTLRCHVIFLSHSKANIYEDEKSERKKKAASMPGAGYIELDISGQGKDEYRRHTDLFAPVVKSKNRKTGKVERLILPNGGRGFEGGTRWELPDEIPAHINRMFKEYINS